MSVHRAHPLGRRVIIRKDANVQRPQFFFHGLGQGKRGRNVRAAVLRPQAAHGAIGRLPIQGTAQGLAHGGSRSQDGDGVLLVQAGYDAPGLLHRLLQPGFLPLPGLHAGGKIKNQYHLAPLPAAQRGPHQPQHQRRRQQ